MKITARYKNWKKKKIENAFYKAFPEKRNYVEPEKQLATMEIVRSYVRPVPVFTIVSASRGDVILDKEFVEYMKKEASIKIGKLLYESGWISYETSDNPYVQEFSLRAEVRVIPPKDK